MFCGFTHLLVAKDGAGSWGDVPDLVCSDHQRPAKCKWPDISELPNFEEVFGIVNLNSQIESCFRSKTLLVPGLISYSGGIYRARHWNIHLQTCHFGLFAFSNTSSLTRALFTMCCLRGKRCKSSATFIGSGSSVPLGDPGGLPWQWLGPQGWEVVASARKCKRYLVLYNSDVADAGNRAEKQSESVRIRKTLLVNMRILHGIFEDEAAAYATLLQFSEFYKAAGGCVPVWASWKCLKVDRIMSIFSLFNIFDPDQITVVSVISTQCTFCCFLAMCL